MSGTEVYTGWSGIDMFAWRGDVCLGRVRAIRWSAAYEMAPVDGIDSVPNRRPIAGMLMCEEPPEMAVLCQGPFDVRFRGCHNDGREETMILQGVELLDGQTATDAFLLFVARSATAWTIATPETKTPGFSLYGDPLL